MSDLEWIKSGNIFTCDVNSRYRLIVKYNPNYKDWSWSVWSQGVRVGSWRNKYFTEQQAKGAAVDWISKYGDV